MDPTLSDFIMSGKRLAEEAVTWGDALHLRITYYLLDAEHPPSQYVSSVRAIVFRRDSVLVVRLEDAR